jgi:hypothetical protein
VQVEELAQGIRQMEHNIRAIAPLGTQRDTAKSLFAITRKRYHLNIRADNLA